VPRSPDSPPPINASAARPYHHGDLRRALLEAALTILRERGPEALTLRAVARAAGVSQTAPYRHFPDGAALVAGVAEDSFRRLFERLYQAVGAPPAPGETERAGLQRLALEYLRFALAHPAEYRIMFGRALGGAQAAGASGPPPASYAEARSSVFALLRGGIAQLQERGMVRSGDASAMALSAWALMHGLAMLTLDGQVTQAGGELSPEALALTATSLMMFGMDAGR
jgi:AcrR family transcriptional regulator